MDDKITLADLLEAIDQDEEEAEAFMDTLVDMFRKVGFDMTLAATAMRAHVSQCGRDCDKAYKEGEAQLAGHFAEMGRKSIVMAKFFDAAECF